MTTETTAVNFYRPTWRAYNQEAQIWVTTALNQMHIPSPNQNQKDAMASFLYTARWCLQTSRHLACPKVKDFWSKYPLVSWSIIGSLAAGLQGKILHHVEGSGSWDHITDKDGKSSSEKVTTLYTVDQSLKTTPFYDSSQFIDVGRPKVLISKPETRGEKVIRKANRKSSPKYGKRQAEQTFKGPYHRLKDEVEELNAFYQQHPLQLPSNGHSEAFCGSVGRVFHQGRLDAGGRFYGAYTGLDGDYRMQCRIDGEPIVQIDLNAAQPILFSSLMGYKIKDTGRENGGWFDLYGEISAEFHGLATDEAEEGRAKLKAVGVELIGSGNPHKRKPSQELQREHRIDEWLFEMYRGKILEWVPALKHLDKNHHNGAGFITYHESQIVLKTIQRLHSLSIPAYPMHDCLIVGASHQQTGIETFREVANRYILEHCRTHNRPQEINIMLAYSVEEAGVNKIRKKGFYL
ncbi:hypothetical protein [Pseudophaeobacter profundi]|uniref:hypothetical protein n=1 Tax=Pseudophaeobacter profundi TaxID=3034152 RepID=UPI002431838E|nr:hypothetical protein [Pseudophaeobacter profundi]